MVRTLLSRAVVPVASVSDAEATAEALRGRLDGTESVIAVHVVEKAGGAPDKASVEQREAEAEAAFGALADGLDGLDVREEIRYGTDVAAAIVEAAHEHDASAIAFTPAAGAAG
ncbi:universal stress protein [Halosimplex aquaticum]